MNYRAVGNHCALDPADLNLSTVTLLEILQRLGFTVIDVDIASLARTFIGTSKYRLKATMAEAPPIFDCSSFTKFLYAKKGIWLPRLSIQQRREGEAVTTLLPGDLVFTTSYQNFYDTDPRENVGHVGIATEIGTIIHATNSEGGVIESTYKDFHSGEPRGIKRIIQPGTITLAQSNVKHLIETSDDFRWLVLRNMN